MKKSVTWLCAILIAVAAPAAYAQCQPTGWTLVSDRELGGTERVCVYEKNSVRMTIVVSGFCPASPC